MIAPDRLLRSVIAMCAASAVLATPAVAQTQGNRAPLLAELPGSAGALVMGGGADLSSGSHAAVFHNVGALRSTGGAAIWLHSFGGRATVLGASTGRSLLGGAFAVGLRHLSHRGEGDGLEPLPADEGGFHSRGSVGLGSVEGTLGYSRAAGYGIRLGVGAKIVEQSVDGVRVSRAAFDVGATRRIGPATVGLTARNLGDDLDFGGASAPLPREFAAGAGVPRRAVGPLDVSGTVNVRYREDEEVIPEGGIEVAYWPIQGRTFVARVGYRDVPTGPASGLGLGAALEWDAWTLSYGWRPYEDLRDGHRIGLAWGG